MMIIDSLYNDTEFYKSTTYDKFEKIRQHIITNNKFILKGIFITFEENNKLQGCLGLLAASRKIDIYGYLMKFTNIIFLYMTF
jgi:hypothetical protein